MLKRPYKKRLIDGIEEWNLKPDPKPSAQTQSIRDKQKMGPHKTKPSAPKKDSYKDKKQMSSTSNAELIAMKKLSAAKKGGYHG